MGSRQRFVVLVALVTTFLMMVGTAYGAPKENGTKDWDISFLGTMQVPAKLEIVDCKDVLVELMKISQEMEKTKPASTKKTNEVVISPEEVAAAFTKNKFGIYEFALKNNGTYNTAMVFAFKMPDELKLSGMTFFDELQKIDKKQQAAIHKQIVTGMNEVFTKCPELKDTFQMEILEFYPFEQMTNKNAQIVSVGGSVAFRMYKLIQPAAFKVYFIKKNTDLYVFGVVNSGQDRKMWDNLSKEMLMSARWKLLS